VRDLITGEQFGRWTVLAMQPERHQGPNGRSRIFWHCRCTCGTEKIVLGESLSRGKSLSCGCGHSQWKIQDLTGVRFGHWTVLAIHPERHRQPNGASQVLWRCRCDCGTESTVLGKDLHNGSSASCGCTRWIHGATGTVEYKAWQNMRERCYLRTHISYADYGGHGIKVCPRWRSDFIAFFADVGPRPSPRHSLDRFPDNDGDYEPGNVRWALMEEQQRNKRNTKLTDTDVRQIYALKGAYSQRQIAQKFGVAASYVPRIQCGLRRATEQGDLS
jgi:hypothetical protein